MQEVRPRGEGEGKASILGGQGNRAGRTGLGRPGSLHAGSSMRVGRCSLVQPLDPPGRKERTQGIGSHIQKLGGPWTKAGARWEPMSKVGP